MVLQVRDQRFAVFQAAALEISDFLPAGLVTDRLGEINIEPGIFSGKHDRRDHGGQER